MINNTLSNYTKPKLTDEYVTKDMSVKPIAVNAIGFWALKLKIE